MVSSSNNIGCFVWYHNIFSHTISKFAFHLSIFAFSKSNDLISGYKKPLFESIFRAADVTKNGNIIKCDEALEVLSLSGISKKKLGMILNMVRNKEDKACSLHREQFYVAVRLVQLKQNHQSVRDPNLTVPDNIYLKAPYFRGISEAESEKTTLVQISKHRDIEQSSTESSTNSSPRYVEMEREINKLKKELQTTVKQLNAVTKKM